VSPQISAGGCCAVSNLFLICCETIVNKAWQSVDQSGPELEAENWKLKTVNWETGKPESSAGQVK